MLVITGTRALLSYSDDDDIYHGGAPRTNRIAHDKEKDKSCIGIQMSKRPPRRDGKKEEEVFSFMMLF